MASFDRESRGWITSLDRGDDPRWLLSADNQRVFELGNPGQACEVDPGFPLDFT